MVGDAYSVAGALLTSHDDSFFGIGDLDVCDAAVDVHLSAEAVDEDAVAVAVCFDYVSHFTVVMFKS